MDDLASVDFTVSLSDQKKTENDITDLIRLLNPDVNVDPVETKLLAGGSVNKVYKIRVRDRTLMVRVFTNITHLLNKTEFIVLSMRAVQHAGLGADVLAYFNNGVVYGYQEGRLINPEISEFDTPEIRRKIVEKIARINQISAKQTTLKSIQLPEKGAYESYFRRCLEHIPESFCGETLFKREMPSFKNKETLTTECEWMLSVIDQLELENVFSHGDLWWGNILYDSTGDNINFIDFDLAGYCEFPLDLASVMAKVLYKGSPPIALTQMSTVEEKSLCRLYIQETRRLQGNQSEVSEHDVDILFALTRIFKPYCLLIMAVLIIAAMHETDISLGYLIVPVEEVYRNLKQEYKDFRREHETLYIKRWKP